MLALKIRKISKLRYKIVSKVEWNMFDYLTLFKKKPEMMLLVVRGFFFFIYLFYQIEWMHSNNRLNTSFNLESNTALSDWPRQVYRYYEYKVHGNTACNMDIPNWWCLIKNAYFFQKTFVLKWFVYIILEFMYQVSVLIALKNPSKIFSQS